jgi:hypothetical protein
LCTNGHGVVHTGLLVSGAPAAATMGTKARQNDANASVVLIFMAPSRYTALVRPTER